jgi:glutaredoxin-like protein NrdH
MQIPVKMYTLSTCIHCKATKQLLNEAAILYEFIDVDLLDGEDQKNVIEEVKKYNPKCSFPTILIGDTVIVGFRGGEIRQALGLPE